MDPHRHAIDDLYTHLRSSAQGLTQADAAQRKAQYGLNQLEKISGQPFPARLLQEFTHFFALILWLAAGLAFFAEWRDPNQGMATLGYAVVGVILINGLFSFWQEYRAEKALTALRGLLPRHATALRDGKTMQLPVSELVPGDVILLSAGDDVPADCRLIEAYGVRVNSANLTGESRPVAHHVDPEPVSQAGLRRDILYAGTSLVSGEAKALVYATGMRTEFGNIARLTQAAHEPLSPLQKEIMHLSKLVALFAMLLGIFFFLIGQAIGLSFWENLVFAIGIIVANVPEGLLPTVTLSLAMATQRMAKKNALVRHLPAVETLGSASVICSDKTGTLTENRMSLSQVFYQGQLLQPQQLQQAEPLFAIMRHCHNLRPVEQDGHTTWLGDPMEAALLEAVPTGLPIYPRIDEIPFDTERKRMSVVCQTPEGPWLYCKGALETVLPLCSHIWLDDAAQLLDENWRTQLNAHQEQLATQGLRVIALAFHPLPDGCTTETGLVFTGLAGLIDPPRAAVPDAIHICREAGIRVIMITGDHPQTASALAQQIGLARNPVTLTGDKLQRMSNMDLQRLLDEPELIFARTSAEQKMRIVQALQRRGDIVAVTGDGVNDAPALKCADIGIAMGISGTNVAKESADIILLDDHFATIVAAIEEGRAVYDNVRKFLTYILTHNVAELVPYLAFALFKIPLPLTVIQILAVDLGTDTLPALALGAEKPAPDIMRKPPRPRRERLLNWGLLLRVYLFLGLLEASAAMAAFFFVLHVNGWQFGQPLDRAEPIYLQATTACFSAIVIMQITNIFLCRHPALSVFDRSLGSNRLIFYGIIFELVLLVLIDYTPLGNALFGTAPLDGQVWLFIIAFMPGMLLLEELRKILVRRK